MSQGLLCQGISSVIVILIAIGLFLFWITMIADCVKRNFSKPKDKLLWLLVIVCLQALGAFIYWLAVQRKS
ncbi:MAG: PLDc N-terminal domain-containing protein [Candidatus Omnitrophica bacterium]|nr:PLDc N-terminal domain-containing protein [Candidatus Omnitrophota bacterium]